MRYCSMARGSRTHASLGSPATGGLLFDMQSVGCAKSRLVGEHGRGRRRAWLDCRAHGPGEDGRGGAADASWD